MSEIRSETNNQRAGLFSVALGWMLHAFLPALLGFFLVGVHYANWVRITHGSAPYRDSHFICCFCFTPPVNDGGFTEAMFGIVVLALCFAIAIKQKRNGRLQNTDDEGTQ